MLTCACSRKIMNMSEVKNFRMVGFAMFADCPKCGKRLAVGELWTKVLTQKGLVEIIEPPKKRKSRTTTVSENPIIA
jgi:hypothetical protein